MKSNYIFVNTQSGKVAEVYAKLQEREDISVAAITMGEHDIVAKLECESEEELYNFYKKFNSLDAVEGIRVLPSFDFKTNGAKLSEAEYDAWVLIRAKGDIDTIMGNLLKIEGTAEVSAVGGQWSILAHVCGSEIEEIGNISLKVQAINGVTATETLLAFPEHFGEEIIKAATPSA